MASRSRCSVRSAARSSVGLKFFGGVCRTWVLLPRGPLVAAEPSGGPFRVSGSRLQLPWHLPAGPVRRSTPRPDSHVSVLFGATDDLTRRKLLPGPPRGDDRRATPRRDPAAAARGRRLVRLLPCRRLRPYGVLRVRGAVGNFDLRCLHRRYGGRLYRWYGPRPGGGWVGLDVGPRLGRLGVAEVGE